MSTVAFTVCFAVWTIFSIIGIQIKKDLGLNETQFGLLIGTPILTGSLSRLLLGIWTDQYGGRLVYTTVMVAAAIATWLLTSAYSYETFRERFTVLGRTDGYYKVCRTGFLTPVNACAERSAPRVNTPQSALTRDSILLVSVIVCVTLQKGCNS